MTRPAPPPCAASGAGARRGCWCPRCGRRIAWPWPAGNRRTCSPWPAAPTRVPVQAALLELLDSREGHFLLESGHHGTLWLDLERLFVRPARLAPCAAELAARLAPHRVEAVCGPFSGGAFLAQLIATTLNADCYYAERLPVGGSPHSITYRVPTALRADLRGRRVAAVDDAINAGSAVRATLADLDACGA